jgi:hypothetical protein
LASNASELIGPYGFRVCKNDADKLELLFFRRCRLIVDFPHFSAAEQRSGIKQTDLPTHESKHTERNQALDPEQPGDEVDQQAETARSGGNAPATRVVDIRAASPPTPLHTRSPSHSERRVAVLKGSNYQATVRAGRHPAKPGSAITEPERRRDMRITRLMQNASASSPLNAAAQ